jgi:serine/threonine protein kinase/Tol biopolymer transport system component
MNLSPGSRLGPYEILAPIGAGGMGEVYRAKDTKLKRDVALKVLPEAFAADLERMARFQREAEVLASLNHPNIAQIYGVEERALVMELVEGESPKGPMAFEEAWKIALQITDALEYAHEKGVIHRDLKPANVKVTPDGVVKLLDFGLARAFSPDEIESANPENSPTLTMGATNLGVILGTAGYMAPEQARGKRVDNRADIWSWGVVLYELLTGERMFQGDEVADTLAQVLTKEPDLKRVPAQVRKLLRRCLEKDPKKRLRDIGETRYLIEGADQPDPQPNAPRRAWLSWAVAVVVGAVAAVISFVHFREEPPGVATLFLPPPENTSFNPNIPTFVVSPDGQRVAFETAENGKRTLWVRDLDNPVPRLLTVVNGNACIPFWAPDSRRLGFFDGTKLKTIDITGGPPFTVTDDGALPPGSGSWNQNGEIIFGRIAASLFRVPASGGSPTPLMALDPARRETMQWLPWFLPDGRHFLFTVTSADPEKSGVYAGDLSFKLRKLVLPFGTRAIYVKPGYLLYVREHALLAQPFNTTTLATTGDAMPVANPVATFTVPGPALGRFSASQNGLLAYDTNGQDDEVQLTWYDRAGNKLDTVGSPGEWFSISLSPDDSTLIFLRRGPESELVDVWKRDLLRGSDSRLTTGGNNTNAVWSPDGTQVYFRSNRDGAPKIYRKNANNTGTEELVEAANKAPSGVSRDGRYLITQTMENNPKTGTDIWLLPLFGDRKATAYVQTEFAETRPSLSPDSRWLAYESNQSRTGEIYVESFPQKGQKWQVSTGGGRLPVWSRNGRELYYFYGNDQLMAVDVKSTVPGRTQSPFGVPKKLFKVRIGSITPGYDVSNDGRFLLPVAASQQEGAAPMTVVLNWPARLKKK